MSYANEAKTELLGVPRIVDRSSTARSARKSPPRWPRACGRGSMPTSGFRPPASPGPRAGTPEKPVGLVYLGLSTAQGTQTRRIDIGLGSTARHHPAPGVESRPQLGAVDACCEERSESGWASLKTARGRCLDVHALFSRACVPRSWPPEGDGASARVMASSRRRSRSSGGASFAARSIAASLPLSSGACDCFRELGGGSCLVSPASPPESKGPRDGSSGRNASIVLRVPRRGSRSRGSPRRPAAAQGRSRSQSGQSWLKATVSA